MKKHFIYLFIFIITIKNYGQTDPLINQLQYGVTLKAKIELRRKKHFEPNLNFRLSAAAGIGARWMINELYPSLNGELLFYNGGLGSSSRKKVKINYTLDGILALTLTSGILSNSFKQVSPDFIRNVPLRYFQDFAIPSLQNPYNCSLSVGTNFAFSTDSDKYSQQIGFADIMVAEGVQISYYNDGTPFEYIKAGDGKDRYYTGGGMISYSKYRCNLDNFSSYSFEISYDKFTGYSQNSFELGNALTLAYVDYKDTEQKYYNKSLWKFNIQTQNQERGYDLAIAYYNSTKYDAQHFIHWVLSDSFHLVPYPGNLTFEPSSFLIKTNFKTN